MNKTFFRKVCVFAIVVFLCDMQGMAQMVFGLPSDDKTGNDTQHAWTDKDGKAAADVAAPSVEVYLPSADKSNGCAMIVCPGGAMRFLAWKSDVEEMARFLNERGVAVIGLKYHLNNSRPPEGMKMQPMVDVTGFDRFPKADANPMHYPEGDDVIGKAVDDAKNAVRFVRSHAEEWNIKPDRVGFLGFSAGGGVAVGATVTAKDKAERPNFLCTNYGPSLMEVTVPADAPPLLVLSRVEHPNVAAGLVSLFLEWKKAGANAEIHLFGDGNGPYQLMPLTGETTTEQWSTLLLNWLQAKGFIEKPVPVVDTTNGKVSGFDHEGSMAFLGIPYAKVERFMPPLPVDKWEDVRRCDHWGPQVMQQTGGRKLSEDEMSEKNSCVLNVWTTDLKAHKPVMLWIHGGGFDSGTSAWNPGMQLAKKDVVVVSLNHRLNILGFLDLSAVSEKYRYSGNVGMLDIVAALQWIRDNIRNFGGDPDNVTIFGESGGGGKVGTLMCMPSARGLFHKAIIMSGTILNVNNREMTRELGKAVVKQLGISEDEIDRIKDVPYDELYAAGQRAMAASIGTRRPGTPMMWGFGPTPDGEVLLQQPFQPGFANVSSEVPLLIGTTLNELQRLRYGQDMTMEEAKKQLEPTFGDDTEDYVKHFGETYPDYTPQDLLSIDWLFRPKTIITADAVAETRKAPTYMYMFTWRSPTNHGSVHGNELSFCFNRLHHAGNMLPKPSDKDLRLADVMSSVWAKFAHDGNPQTSDVPVWKPYTAKGGDCMIFDYNCYVRNNHDRKLEEIINRHCFKQLDEFVK